MAKSNTKLLTERELIEVNRLRRNMGLRDIVTKKRKCANCDEEFLSQGLRLCPKCQALRHTPAAHGDGCAYPDGGTRCKGSGKVGKFVG